MFLRIYKQTKEEIDLNESLDFEQIKNFFKINIDKFISTYYPRYKQDFGGMQSVIEEVSHNLAGGNEDYAQKYNQEFSNELNNMVYKWQQYLNLEELIDKISGIMANMYLNSKSQSFQGSLEDAVISTISRNIDRGLIIRDEEHLVELLKIIFKKYFKENNINIFTSSNNARAYVSSKSKEELLEEMKAYTNFDSSVPDSIMEDVIINNYVNKLAGRFDISPKGKSM